MLTFLLTVSTVALAGIGGLYYAFMCAVMPGLKKLDDRTFVLAMREINTRIRNIWFALGFAGAFLALAATGVYTWAREMDAAVPVTFSFFFYAATLVITFGANIPLNNRLERNSMQGNEGQARRAFEATWNRWNAFRALFSLAAILCLCPAWG